MARGKDDVCGDNFKDNAGCRDFDRFINDNQLVDPNSFGLHFTWFNKCQESDVPSRTENVIDGKLFQVNETSR